MPTSLSTLCRLRKKDLQVRVLKSRTARLSTYVVPRRCFCFVSVPVSLRPAFSARKNVSQNSLATAGPRIERLWLDADVSSCPPTVHRLLMILPPTTTDHASKSRCKLFGDLGDLSVRKTCATISLRSRRAFGLG